LEEMRRDTKCLSGAGGETRYVSMMSIDAVVGTLSVRKRHVILHTRELLSEEQYLGVSHFHRLGSSSAFRPVICSAVFPERRRRANRLRSM